MNRRADRGRMGKSQKSAKPYGRATPNWNPQSGIHFSSSLSQAKDHPLINVRKILDTTPNAAAANTVTEVAPYVNTILAHHLRWSPIH